MPSCLPKFTHRLIEEILREIEELKRIATEMAAMDRDGTASAVTVQIDGRPLGRFIRRQSESLCTRIRSYSNRPPSRSVLKRFITECETLFRALGPILADRFLALALGVDPEG